MVSTHTVAAVEHWAIVVGIGAYPEESGWRTISGDNDIELIVPMLERSGFTKGHILTLSNERATKDNIKKAFAYITTKLKAGDVVYFHFSGHGQLITDINGDEGDYGWDESIIPYDAQLKYSINGYKGENHIVDDELNSWLMSIRNKIGNNGKILVALDACHSGGGSRSEDDKISPERGVTSTFNLPTPAPAHTAPRFLVRWVCVSACKSIQSNCEYQTSTGRIYGRLSYALSLIFSPNMTVEELLSKLQQQYSKMPLRYPQDPLIEFNNSSIKLPVL